LVGRGEKPEKQAARRELGGADERKKSCREGFKEERKKSNSSNRNFHQENVESVSEVNKTLETLQKPSKTLKTRNLETYVILDRNLV